MRSGLSCLLPSTKDEDVEPLAPAKSSPEKKMSPSGRSISDIFGKVEKILHFSFNLIHFLCQLCYVQLTRIKYVLTYIAPTRHRIAPFLDRLGKLRHYFIITLRIG